MPGIPHSFTITVPSGGGAGTLTFTMPDVGTPLIVTAGSLSTIAVSLVNIAVIVQTVCEPQGGVRFKDLLDPYQYNVVKASMDKSGIPVPPPPAVGTGPNLLGTTLSAAGALGSAASAAGALGVVTPVPLAPPVGAGIVTGGGAAVPDPTIPMVAVNAALSVISTALSYISTTLNQSVDITSRSLLIKHVLSLFQVNVTNQSLVTAGIVPPAAPPDLA